MIINIVKLKGQKKLCYTAAQHQTLTFSQRSHGVNTDERGHSSTVTLYSFLKMNFPVVSSAVQIYRRLLQRWQTLKHSNTETGIFPGRLCLALSRWNYKYIKHFSLHVMTLVHLLMLLDALSFPMPEADPGSVSGPGETQANRYKRQAAEITGARTAGQYWTLCASVSSC